MPSEQETAIYIACFGAFFVGSCFFFAWAVARYIIYKRRTAGDGSAERRSRRRRKRGRGGQQQVLVPHVPARMWHVSEFAYRLPEPAEVVPEPRSGFGPGGTCFVCFDAPRNAILMECGHAGICVSCAVALQAQGARCPLCRVEFEVVVCVSMEDPDSGAAAVHMVSYVPGEGGHGAV